MPLHAQEEAENDATQQQQTRRRSPQASRGERNDKKDTGLPELTVRAQDMNERLTQEIGNARWMRIIYRQVDLMKEQNAPLYYPTRPMNGQMNLFSVIFQLLGENKIKAYEYLDGYEEFDEAQGQRKYAANQIQGWPLGALDWLLAVQDCCKATVGRSVRDRGAIPRRRR